MSWNKPKQAMRPHRSKRRGAIIVRKMSISMYYLRISDLDHGFELKMFRIFLKNESF